MSSRDRGGSVGTMGTRERAPPAGHGKGDGGHQFGNRTGREYEMNTLNVDQAFAQLARLGGRALVADVLAACRRQVPERLREAREACERGDARLLARSAHALRSSCGQLGATELSERCARLEALGESGTVEGAMGGLDQLGADLDDLLRDLEGRLIPGSAPDLRRRVVGLVEDNEDTRLILQRMLEPYFEVDAHADGTAALEGFRRRPPDVILLDISLPGLDGPAVLDEMRGDPVLCLVPAIALTAHAMVGDREWYLSNGFDEYISKPILDERDLVRILRDVMERRREP